MAAVYAEPGVPNEIVVALTLIDEHEMEPAILATILHGLGYGAGVSEDRLAVLLADVGENLARRDALLADPTTVEAFAPEDDMAVIGSLYEAGVALADAFDDAARSSLRAILTRADAA